MRVASPRTVLERGGVEAEGVAALSPNLLQQQHALHVGVLDDGLASLLALLRVQQRLCRKRGEGASEAGTGGQGRGGVVWGRCSLTLVATLPEAGGGETNLYTHRIHHAEHACEPLALPPHEIAYCASSVAQAPSTIRDGSVPHLLVERNEVDVVFAAVGEHIGHQEQGDAARV